MTFIFFSGTENRAWHSAVKNETGTHWMTACRIVVRKSDLALSSVGDPSVSLVTEEDKIRDYWAIRGHLSIPMAVICQ